MGRVRAQIKERLDEAAETLRRTGPAIGASLRALVEPGDITLGSTEFASILHAVESFDSGAAQSSSDLRQRFDTMASTTDVQMASWRTKEAEVLQQIETKRKELEAQGLRLDMAHIQKLTRDEATHHTNVVNLNTWKPHLTQLRKDRADVLKRGWSARDNVATLRNAYAHQASEVLDRELLTRR